MRHAAIESLDVLSQVQPRGVQVPMWAAVLILVGFLVVGLVLWRIREDR